MCVLGDVCVPRHRDVRGLGVGTKCARGPSFRCVCSETCVVRSRDLDDTRDGSKEEEEEEWRGRHKTTSLRPS